MSDRYMEEQSDSPSIPNGSASAAILSAGIGILLFSITAFVGDKSAAIKADLNFYKPTGPLSGVVTIGLASWLLSWFIFGKAWSDKNVSAKGVCVIAIVLLVVGLLLTFPPFVDLI
jgi:hypothetical protein